MIAQSVAERKSAQARMDAMIQTRRLAIMQELAAAKYRYQRTIGTADQAETWRAYRELVDLYGGCER